MNCPELVLAKTAAATAGEIIRNYFRQGTSGAIKSLDGKDQGQVTAADLDAERAITQCIHSTFPDHAILAEEEHTQTHTSEHLWVIDPLDGTNNFAHGIPHFSVSIAYYRNGEAVCGVVHDPIRDDWFTTTKGQGSFQNGQKVSVNAHHEIPETMIALGFYYDRGEMMRNTLAAMEKFYEANIQGIRRFGGAALDLVYVGTGKLGGYFEYTLSPWDFAAAKLFVEEAGGQVTDCEGEPLTLTKSSVLASNGLLHSKMSDIVSRRNAN
jgi:myo-inositol-1(or 4)-monophosphatase